MTATISVAAEPDHDEHDAQNEQDEQDEQGRQDAGRQSPWGLRAAIVATVIVTGALLTVAAVRHRSESVSGDVLSETSVRAPTDLRAAPGSKVVFYKLTIHPGGTGGWHTHSGPVLVTVVQGTVTEYSIHGVSCMERTIKTGDAVVEQPGFVHTYRNEGKRDIVLYGVSLRPKGSQLATPRPRPAFCDH